MEDSGKHRFHGREHDSKMRLFKTYSHTSTLRAPGKPLKQKTTSEGRKTGKKIQNTPANGGIDRRESYHFRRFARGMRQEKRESGNCVGKIETRTKCESAGDEDGRVKDLAVKPRAVAKTYQNTLRTKPNSRARNGHRASPCGGDVKTGRRITRKILLGKDNKKHRTITNIPRGNGFEIRCNFTRRFESCRRRHVL